jgi:Domain of unknown function (DUF4249)
MKHIKHIILFLLVTAPGWMGCKEVYTPPAITNTPNFLVVDGIVIDGMDSTIITLSRTRSLADTVPSVKEANANVSVVGLTGVEYPLVNQGNGRYVLDQLLLDTTQQYQLKILTSDGNEFRSEPGKVYTSPPIDSVYWNQDSFNNVHVYVNTHDPSNSTKYYRWEYVETWEYHSAYQSVIEYIAPNNIIVRGPDNQIYRCYSTLPSSSIEVVSTTQLSSDVVNKYEVTQVPVGSEKISQLYSDQVKQYAIPADAFNFWENLKKNSENLGSLFDLQPFSEFGNITCVNNPAVKCIGFISFTTLQQQRIFISRGSVAYWNYYPYYGGCSMDTIPPNQVDQFFQPAGGPYFNSLIGTDNGYYLLSGNICVDCTDHGGSPTKPPFWP